MQGEKLDSDLAIVWDWLRAKKRCLEGMYKLQKNFCSVACQNDVSHSGKDLKQNE